MMSIWFKARHSGAQVPPDFLQYIRLQGYDLSSRHYHFHSYSQMAFLERYSVTFEGTFERLQPHRAAF